MTLARDCAAPSQLLLEETEMARSAFAADRKGGEAALRCGDCLIKDFREPLDLDLCAILPTSGPGTSGDCAPGPPDRPWVSPRC